jgi:hypothetical protein
MSRGERVQVGGGNWRRWRRVKSLGSRPSSLPVGVNIEIKFAHLVQTHAECTGALDRSHTY